jgi:hypothetical protein
LLTCRSSARHGWHRLKSMPGCRSHLFEGRSHATLSGVGCQGGRFHENVCREGVELVGCSCASSGRPASSEEPPSVSAALLSECNSHAHRRRRLRGPPCLRKARCRLAGRRFRDSSSSGGALRLQQRGGPSDEHARATVAFRSARELAAIGYDPGSMLDIVLEARRRGIGQSLDRRRQNCCGPCPRASAYWLAMSTVSS